MPVGLDDSTLIKKKKIDEISIGGLAADVTKELPRIHLGRQHGHFGLAAQAAVK